MKAVSGEVKREVEGSVMVYPLFLLIMLCLIMQALEAYGMALKLNPESKDLSVKIREISKLIKSRGGPKKASS